MSSILRKLQNEALFIILVKTKYMKFHTKYITLIIIQPYKSGEQISIQKHQMTHFLRLFLACTPKWGKSFLREATPTLSKMGQLMTTFHFTENGITLPRKICLEETSASTCKRYEEPKASSGKKPVVDTGIGAAGKIV